MDKIWVKDVKEGDRLKSVFLVAKKAVPTAKSGRAYLAVTLQDKTGELEARAFDKVEELANAFEEKSLVEVDGLVGAFQGKPQLRLESATKPAEGTEIDPTEFLWAPPPEPKKPDRSPASPQDDALFKELLVLVEQVTDPHVKALIQAFVEDEDIVTRLKRWPAAKTVHHAYPGGLLEHTVSCLKLAHRLADHYPQVDRDLLVAGAFFHDLGKIRELGAEKNPEYTDEGRLVGHLVLTAEWIHDKARRIGVPRELEHHVVHLVLAHHGRLEYGSPKVPMTLEALLTHQIDELDSRVNSWLNLMGREAGHRRWTSSENVYEQPIWRGALPTVQAEKKGPPEGSLAPVIYVPHDAQHAAAGTGQPRRSKGEQRKQRRPEPRPPVEEAKPAPAPGGTEGAPPAASAEAQGEAPASAPERKDRPERARGGEHRPERAPREARGPGGFADKKRGYQGPRLPGDKGPHRAPEKKNLTHNPFAALAAKLEEPGKAQPGSAEPEAAAPPSPPAPSETVNPEVENPVPAETAAAAEPKPTEGA